MKLRRTFSAQEATVKDKALISIRSRSIRNRLQLWTILAEAKLCSIALGN